MAGKRAEVEPVTAALVLLSLVLALAAIIPLGCYTFYTDLRGRGWLVLLPLAGWGAGLFLGLLEVRRRAEPRTPESREYRLMGWSSLGLIPVGITAFFLLYPGAATWAAADIYQNLGQYEKARTRYEACLERAPDSKFVLYDLAVNSHTRRDWRAAVEYFERAHRMDPDYWHWGMATMLIDAHWRMGNRDGAVRWCREVRSDYPDMLPSCKEAAIEKSLERMREYGFNYDIMSFAGKAKKLLGKIMGRNIRQ